MGDSVILQLTHLVLLPSLQGGYDSGRPGDGTVADLITFDPEEEETRIERSMSVDSYHMDPERIERVKHPSSEQVCSSFLLFFFPLYVAESISLVPRPPPFAFTIIHSWRRTGKAREHSSREWRQMDVRWM